MDMTKTEAIRSLRLAWQRLCDRVGEEDYDRLFRLMSPVQTEYWCCPGSPPRLSLRAGFDDADYTFRLRAARRIIKGRFQNGGIAYIFADELPLFAAAYRKDPDKLSGDELRLLTLLRQEGPMSIGTMKELTGVYAKNITPVLHKLQEKFLVFEDQADNEWDRAWYLFETEFPDADLARYARLQAIAGLLLRFAGLQVFFTADMAQSYYKLPAKDIRAAAASLMAEGALLTRDFGDGAGYILPEDERALDETAGPAAESVFALHRNDFLVKSEEYRLKNLYKTEECDVLQYLLIDGAFGGAVLGHFKNGPFIVEDVVVELPKAEAQARREEVLAAVRRVNDPVASPVKRYCGKEL